MLSEISIFFTRKPDNDLWSPANYCQLTFDLPSPQGGGLLIEDIFTEGNAFLDGRLSEGTYVG